MREYMEKKGSVSLTVRETADKWESTWAIKREYSTGPMGNRVVQLASGKVSSDNRCFEKAMQRGIRELRRYVVGE